MRICFCVFLSGLAFSVLGAPQLAPVFRNNMVFQRDAKVPVWGTAEPDEEITLEFAGQKVSTAAKSDGTWRINLAPMPVSAENTSLFLSGKDKRIELRNILVGDVWLCGGQSNMDMLLKSTLDGESMAQNADLPILRICRVFYSHKNDRMRIQWDTITPKVAPDVSAVAFYFGRELTNELKIPIGLLNSSNGGTLIETWIPPEAWETCPELKKQVDLQYLTKDNSLKDQPFNQPSMLYNKKIKPLVPFAIKGTIWYQGCANARKNAESYLEKQKMLYSAWGKVFEKPDMSFYTVQIAPYFRRGDSRDYHLQIWEAQEKFACQNPKVRMVVTNDVGDIHAIHPMNKAPVGIRLAKLALKYDYGHNIPADSPQLRNHQVTDGEITLEFDYVNSWNINGDTLWEVCDENGKYFPAQVKLQGAKLLISSSEVKHPATVRYLWKCDATGSMFNEVGLPLGAFRCKLTD